MPRDLQEQFEDRLENYVRMIFYSDTGAPKEAIAACLREESDPVPYIVKILEWASAAANTREWFGRHGPAHLQPLPFGEQENLLCSGCPDQHILMHYGISLRHRGFNYLGHPLFFDYARGVTALPDEFEKYSGLIVDDELLAEYPPKPLAGLGNDLRWRPPS